MTPPLTVQEGDKATLTLLLIRSRPQGGGSKFLNDRRRRHKLSLKIHRPPPSRF